MAIIFLAVMALLGSFNFIHNLDFKSLDSLYRPHTPHPDIIILAVDNKSLSEISRWPWDRQIHAQIINKLGNYRPRAVAIDINFSEPQNLENDTLLKNSATSANFPIILATQIIKYNCLRKMEPSCEDGILKPLALFSNNPNVFLGSVNVSPAPDGLARNFPDNKSFSFTVAQIINSALPPSDSYAVNFVGPAGSFPTYSISDFLQDKILSENLQNKIILIGATASDLHDIIPVPPDNGLMAGIEWHANVLDNILLQRPLRIISRNYITVFGLLMGVIIMVISNFLFGLTALIILPIISFSFLQFNLALPYFFIDLVVIGGVATRGLYQWYVVEMEKRKLRRTVQNYFSPQVLEKILQDPASLKLGGERREITILFSDIRSFTTITETTPPEILSALLHEYFTEMTEEVLATDGVVDKFIGDAIMAFWGTPFVQKDHAQRAINAALGMMRRLEKLQVRWQEKSWPYVDIGIGIHTGMATVGNMGSAKRFDYTVIGDSVNAASRLEGLNKEYKTHIIISEETKNKLTESVNCRLLGEVKVKGKTMPLKIYEVVL